MVKKVMEKVSSLLPSQSYFLFFVYSLSSFPSFFVPCPDDEGFAVDGRGREDERVGRSVVGQGGDGQGGGGGVGGEGGGGGFFHFLPRGGGKDRAVHGRDDGDGTFGEGGGEP